MTVQVIPVRTTGPAQTEWTDSTAAARQDLMGHNVNQVTVTDNISSLIFCMNNKITMFKSNWEQIKSGVFFSDWQPLERANDKHLVFEYYGLEEKKMRTIFSGCLGNFYLFSIQQKNVSISSLQYISSSGAIIVAEDRKGASILVLRLSLGYRTIFLFLNLEQIAHTHVQAGRTFADVA